MRSVLNDIADYSFMTVHNSMGYRRSSSFHYDWGQTPGERWQISHGGPSKDVFRHRILEALHESV